MNVLSVVVLISCSSPVVDGRDGTVVVIVVDLTVRDVPEGTRLLLRVVSDGGWQLLLDKGGAFLAFPQWIELLDSVAGVSYDLF